MTVTVLAGELEEQIESKILHLTKTAKLPGFRSGKVPRKVVESRFSSQVLQESVEKLIDASYREALQEKSIIPVGLPSIEAKKMVRGEDLEYVATFEVFPEITKPNIQGREIEKLIFLIEEDDVDRTIEMLRRQHIEWEEKQTSAESGDRLLIDYVGSIEGELFEGGESKDYPLILGQGGLLPEFEAGLNNQLPGAEVLISAEFPADYSVESVAGKTAVFTVTVKSVAKPRLPIMNEDFIQKFGVSAGTEEAFRAQIRQNLQQEAETRVKTTLRTAVFAALLDSHEFEIPKILVEEEIDRGVSAFQNHAQQQRLPIDQPMDREQYREEAERRVRLALVMREVVSDQAIKADDSEIRSRIEKLAQSYDDPKQVIDWHYSDPARLRQFEGVVVEELLLEHLLAEAKIVEKKVTLQQLMNINSSNVIDTVSEQDQEA